MTHSVLRHWLDHDDERAAEWVFSNDFDIPDEMLQRVGYGLASARGVATVFEMR